MSEQLPHSLDIVQECFPNIKVPEEPFDPRGEWEHKYLSWVALRGNVGKSWAAGGLAIRRKLRTDGIVELEILQVRKQVGNRGSDCASAVIACKDDLLSTPLSWKLDWAASDRKGNPVEYARNQLSGQLSRGSIVQRGEKVRRTKAPADLTSNWSLIDAVQRLPFDTKPISFCMLDDMELVKPNQVLSPGPEVEVELGGRQVRLHSFVQIGDGILPYSYWLDDNHRLLLAIGGLCAYLYDPSVSLPEMKP